MAKKLKVTRTQVEYAWVSRHKYLDEDDMAASMNVQHGAHMSDSDEGEQDGQEGKVKTVSIALHASLELVFRR